MPLVFGLGAPLVAMVGTNIGAGQRERALRAAWIGAAIAFGLAEAIGLAGGGFPAAVALARSTRDPAMLEAGSAVSARASARCTAFSASGLALYFASQGAGRLLWPVLANLARLAVAALGGWLALRWGGSLSQVFLAQGVALVVYGLINAFAVAGGAWFGPVGWPRFNLALVARPTSVPE